jgi:RNA polymerase sigma-70 factor, ECF subfamily
LKVIENALYEQCLVAAAQRDRSRFAELYENNFDRVYAYVARRISNRSDAEDVTAEVFHQALRGLPGFEWQGVPFAGWLLGIAAHVLATRWRHAFSQQVLFEDNPPGGDDNDCVDLASSVPDPRSIGSRITDSRIEEAAMLRELVDELPSDQRRVVLRRFVDQKSVREIAEELGRSEGAVKQLQFRALQNLRMRIRSCHGQSV